MIRTRFAPSPTGYLHIGGARTALFSWAYARRHGGRFVLRIEDTDRERSTPDSVRAILDGLSWLGIDWDEGPTYQMDRVERYREVADQLIAQGLAYPCYATPAELDEMRERQRAAGLKPRYDGRWRPEPGKSLPAPPAGANPVIRFRNPEGGGVSWDDLIKGRIAIANDELDDLVILRPDATPTYNFGVVVDDLDMGITHVIRGDDHVNNTPRQINIIKALGAQMPTFAHVPMILGTDGERLSKRHGAVSVLQYRDEGFLPEALLNYLARLGWSHGDEELFTMDQLTEWFDVGHVSKSPAKFNPEKLAWVNAQYLKTADAGRLAQLTADFLRRAGVEPAGGPDLAAVVDLLRERASTLAELADASMLFYRRIHPTEDLMRKHIDESNMAALRSVAAKLATIEWDRQEISRTLAAVVAEHGLKMPKIGMPLRVLVTGESQTPAIDATLFLIGRDEVLRRLDESLSRF